VARTEKKNTEYEDQPAEGHIPQWCGGSRQTSPPPWEGCGQMHNKIVYHLTGTKVSQYSSLGKRGSQLYFHHNAQQINVNSCHILLSPY